MRSRLGLIGNTSFTGRTLIDRFGEDAFQVLDHRANPDEQDLGGLECVVNCAFHPALNEEPYCEDLDLDLRWAKAIHKVGGHFVMLSSRRVYAEEVQFGADENSRIAGLDAYGRNKSETERRLAELLAPEKLTVLRIGNLIGLEFPRNRRSLMGYIMEQLVAKGSVEFTHSPFSRRDCLPVEVASEVIFQVMKDRLPGIYTLGAGFPTMIGQIALWVIEGYGQGELTTSVGGSQGEFWLRVEKLRSRVPFDFSLERMEEWCVNLGRSLNQRLGEVHPEPIPDP